jgi:hypothetical protein
VQIAVKVAALGMQPQTARSGSNHNSDITFGVSESSVRKGRISSTMGATGKKYEDITIIKEALTHDSNPRFFLVNGD